MIEEAREIFEDFEPSIKQQKDNRGNYRNHVVHNLFVGFKNWYIRECKKQVNISSKDNFHNDETAKRFWFNCPNCKRNNIPSFVKYCPDCGIKLNWVD